jgi:hypothetical protein
MTILMQVYSRPLEGMEDEYNDWYNKVHLSEVVAIQGILSAQRYELTEAQQIPEQNYKYLAVYELENENVLGTLKNLLAAASTMDMGSSLDLKSAQVSIFKSITDVIS